MSFLDSLRAAFKGGAGKRVPLARSYISPWSWAFEPAGTRPPFEYRNSVRYAYIENPVAQRAVRLVAEGVGSAPLLPSEEAALALVSATSAGQSLLETLAAQLLLHGNGYVQVVRDGAGAPIELFALRPERVAGQAQKEVFVNEAHALADALLHPAIEGEADAPPAAPAAGECWLVGDTPTGDWVGHAGEIASFQPGGWIFAAPRDGVRVLDRSTGQDIRYRGTWQRPETPAAPSGGTTVDAEARAAIADLVAALVAGGLLAET